ncbi:hypothetical protein PAPYR_5586 [Paratrimastix pyriformis]|uniref:Uncharacterized protein n=1 Tax=Paratrimastix pyriformis TaxID=342808 RepID=A0ABQ8UK74_9EUKA|nr:hypothetical protein PAPYR_5586 [Paratrimastix pyriformis]
MGLPNFDAYIDLLRESFASGDTQLRLLPGAETELTIQAPLPVPLTASRKPPRMTFVFRLPAAEREKLADTLFEVFRLSLESHRVEAQLRADLQSARTEISRLTDEVHELRARTAAMPLLQREDSGEHEEAPKKPDEKKKKLPRASLLNPIAPTKKARGARFTDD